jgi:NAD(P)-dependent dehydrogenase (short-subunit alcohol dehydrogenase family)
MITGFMQTVSLYESIRPRYPEFKDQVALVTGSSRGIGKGIALRLAREGMKVVIHGMNEQEVTQTTQEFEALGVDALGVQADFTRESDIERLFEALKERYGRLDLLVNNAADLRRKKMLEPHLPLLDLHLAVNIRAPYLCGVRAAEMMKVAKRGSIINISSVGGTRAHWTGLPYDVSKGAIDAMTRAMALELAREGIRVNAIAPGAIRGEEAGSDAVTQRIPMARYGQPLEIGATVAFLHSEDAGYITGTIVYVDGGITAQLYPPGQPI